MPLKNLGYLNSLYADFSNKAVILVGKKCLRYLRALVGTSNYRLLLYI